MWQLYKAGTPFDLDVSERCCVCSGRINLNKPLYLSGERGFHGAFKSCHRSCFQYLKE